MIRKILNLLLTLIQVIHATGNANITAIENDSIIRIAPLANAKILTSNNKSNRDDNNSSNLRKSDSNSRNEKSENDYNRQYHILRESFIDVSAIISRKIPPDALDVQLFHDERPITFQRQIDVWNNNQDRSNRSDRKTCYWYGESEEGDSFNIEVNDKDCTGYVVL